MRSLLPFAALLALVLSGCGAPSKPSAGADQLDLSKVAVQTTDTLGGIRGVVVDAAIRPVAGADVTLVGQDQNATTDTSGVFTFDRMAPGTYFIDVHAARFTSTQTSTVVLAGQVATVKIALEANLTPLPYHDTAEFDGFIQQSAPLASYIVDIVTSGELNQSTCSCLGFFDTLGNASTYVFEMVWTPTSPAPMSDDLYYQFYENGKDDVHIKDEFHTSPVLQHWDPAFWGNWTSFVAHYGGSAYGVNVNQAFKSFFTAWYNGAAPDDWSVVKGDP